MKKSNKENKYYATLDFLFEVMCATFMIVIIVALALVGIFGTISVIKVIIDFIIEWIHEYK